MKYVYLLFLVLISFTANAQTIACIKTPEIINTSCVMSPLSHNLPEQFGFFAIKNRIVFNFRWLDKLKILPGFKDSQLPESIIVVKMDNDSLITFKPLARFSRIESPMFQKNDSLFLYIESDITKKELVSFKDHKALSLTLITGENIKYDLFVFSDQNRTDITRTADCFLDKLSEK